jgi:Right handed beta helix region
VNTRLLPRILRRLPWIAIGCLALAACTSSSSVNVTVRPGTGLPPGVSGVACQDNTGDAARIQGVIDASAPGATIQINGTCVLTRGLVLPGDRTYVGGPTTGTVLEQHGPMSFVLASSAYTSNSTTTGDPLQIRNLTVACDGSGSTDGIIVMDWQTDVQQVDVHNCGGSGIVDTSVAQNGKAITNTSVNSRFDDNFVSDSGQYGFEVLDPVNAVTDGFFTDNQVATSGAGGVYLQNSEGWLISGNHLYGDGGDGIDATRLYATTISDNYIEDFGVTMQSGRWYGITGTAQDRLGSVIEGNKVFNLASEPRGASHIYIAVTVTNNGTGYLSVFGNVIATVASADTAFYFNGAPNALVVASAANQVSGPGTTRTLGAGVTLHSGM